MLSRLLRAAAEATKPHSEAYAQIIKAIEDDHIAAAKAVIRSEDLFQALSAAITAECKDLLRVLQSAQHLGEVSPSTEDKIVSKGEALSCRFLAALLQDNGVNAVFVDMSEVLKAHTGPSLPRLDETFYLDLARKLGDVVNAAVGEDIQCVPVVTGYFGRVPSGLLNSIGRGYTDLCAALVAVGLRAKELQVWKEVDGIFTADPRKVPTARLLDSVTPSEAAELTFYGSEVIHPFTMQQVIRASIPIRIKNVMNPRNKGTFIFPEPATAFQNSPFGSPSLQGSQRSISSSRILTIKRASSSNNIYPSRQRVKRPTAVTVKHKIVILNVHSNKRTRAHGFLMNIFKVLDKYHLTVDLISSSEVHVSMALHSEKELLSDPSSSDETPPSASLQPGLALDGFGEEEARELDIRDADLLGAVNELREFGTIDLVNNMAIVSLVGRQLRNMVGISGKFFKTLGDNNINIEMISQGEFCREPRTPSILWANENR